MIPYRCKIVNSGIAIAKTESTTNVLMGHNSNTRTIVDKNVLTSNLTTAHNELPQFCFCRIRDKPNIIGPCARFVYDMPHPILIRNPLPGSQSYTTPNRAQRFVRRGRARWISAREIEFLDAPNPSRAPDPTRRGYDEIKRCMRPIEIRRIPIVGWAP